jgi:hypothetical protein
MTYRTPRYDTDDNGTVDNAEKLEGNALADLDLRYLLDQSGTVDTSNIATGAVTSTEIADSTIQTGDLAFDPATQTELNSHASTADAHHARYTDEEAQDAVGTILSAEFSYDDAGNSISLANDSVTVSPGNALTGGGSVALGQTTTLNVDESAISHDNISGVSSDDHHTRYSDSEAVSAVETATSVYFDGTVGLTGGGTIDGVEQMLAYSTSDMTVKMNGGKFIAKKAASGTDNLVVNPNAHTVTANNELYEGSNRVATRTWVRDRFGQLNMVSKTANYTASENDGVLADASGGAITVTLPTPATGANVAVKKVDSSSNSVTVSQSGTETIDGSASITLTEQYEALTLWSDGTDWFIM